MAGDLGEDVARVARDVLGFELSPWQRYAAGRATELRRDGTLKWPTVVVTIARGAGKSWFLQAMLTWRLLSAVRFGEPQEIVSVAQAQNVARLSWERPAKALKEAGLVEKVGWGRGMETIVLPDGGTWRVLAARLSATTGYRASLVAVDEAWAVDRTVVEQGLVPQMRRRRQTQLLVVSTAGDGRSDLLLRLRDRALAGDSGILLMEWSAEPSWPAGEEAAWRWANPDWSKDTGVELDRLFRSTPESRFRSQYLNQWVSNVESWIGPTVWARCEGREPPGTGGVVAVDCAPDGDSWGGVWASVLADGRVAVRACYDTRPERVWEWVAQTCTDARVVLGASVDGLQPGWVGRAGTFGSAELRAWLPGVRQMLVDGKVRHDGHRVLTEHVMRAQTGQTQAGLVFRLGVGPHELCRMMVAAVGVVVRHRGPVLV